METSTPNPTPTPNPNLVIERVYLRDASFESPKAPAVFTEVWKPSVHLDINTRSNRLDGTRHEVVLTVTLEAKLDDKVAMLVELQQAGIFRLDGMDDAVRRQALATACPNILFPYARETLDSLIIRGGLPPMLLAPMNFDALFAEARRRQAMPSTSGNGNNDPVH